MSENIDAYKSGQVALQMNFAFIWPGVHADSNVGGDKSGYFPNPAGPGGHFAQLGGQASQSYPTLTAKMLLLSILNGLHNRNSKTMVGARWLFSTSCCC